MSYTRHFHKDIRIPLEVDIVEPSVSSNGNGGVHTSNGSIKINFNGKYHHYSIGAHGSSGSHDLSHDERVDVNIEVDTVPFDNSVDTCNDSVTYLTAGIAAAEAAEIVSIEKNSLRVGNTIIEGFFNNVRFEISSKVMELTKRIDALLMDIKEKSERLLALKSQMELDYNRTAERYGNIFGELNKELENRVFALDRPVFDVSRSINAVESRLFESDLINIVAVAGKENAILDAQLSAVVTKQHARKALTEANTFLSKKHATEITIRRCSIDDDTDKVYYMPVCVLRANNEQNVYDSNLYCSDLAPISNDKIISQSDNIENWEAADCEAKETIARYFNGQLNEVYASSDEHSNRVKLMMSTLFTNNK